MVLLGFYFVCLFGGEKVVVMIVLVFDIKINIFWVIYRICFNLKDKKMLGFVGGGCVKFLLDEEVFIGFYICEGIEIGLVFLVVGF